MRDFEIEEYTSNEMEKAKAHESLLCPATDAFINYTISQYPSITTIHASVIKNEFMEAITKTGSKLKALINGYEGGRFLHSLSVFDPSQKSNWESEFDDIVYHLMSKIS
eukprot:TRINITY_DN7586_c0_g3_i5.p1 TRINITY_DN7586_c0_g3~~TRINITY_DN7586_c0_g3_i5.p1  ORF type:complete len:109 (+),score=9.61 TRINITY_DN7586_c0_g3_i5:1-327(+)